MLAVLESAPREEDRQVLRVVVVAVAEIRAVEDDRAVEQRLAVLLHRGELPQQLCQLLELGEFEALELLDRLRPADVVGEVVSLHADPRDVLAEAIELDHQRDQPGRVGGKREVSEFVHCPELFEQVFLILGLGRGRLRLRLLLPLLGDEHPPLHLADAREILIDPVAVAGAERPAERRGPVGHAVENAAAGAKPVQLLLDGGRVAGHEERPVDLRRAVLSRHHHAARREGERLIAVLRHDERQPRHAGVDADPLRGELVERDRVFEGGRAGVRRRCEKRRLGGMPARDIAVRRARHDRELVAKILEGLEVGREGEVAARLLGEEALPIYAEIRADRQQPAGLRIGGLAGGGPHRVEQRQGEGGTGTP